MIIKTKYKKTSELNLKAQVYKFISSIKIKAFPRPSNLSEGNLRPTRRFR